MLVNVRSHMMFRPELIYIFDLIVNRKNNKNRCLSLKSSLQNQNYYLNYIMPCLFTALTRSAIKKTTRKNNKQQNKQK